MAFHGLNGAARWGLIQEITFRLHDSMPGTVLEQWAKETEGLPEIQHDTERHRRIAEVVDNTRLHFDDRDQKMDAYSILLLIYRKGNSA